MKNSLIVSVMFVAFLALGVKEASAAERANLPPRGVGQSLRPGTMVERERPQLNEETRRLIAAYRLDPTQDNYDALRKQVAANYDQVIARKKAKLEELRRTARHQAKITEMEEIVDEVVRDRDNRIEQSMRRFTDPRLRPGARETNDGFLPVIGAAQNVSIAYAPVTNEEYAQFVSATNRPAPAGWSDKRPPAGKERHPVVNVSYHDALAYAEWLTRNGPNQGNAIYRLPTEQEWEYAAGHMPKDADFNCGVNSGTTPVDAYARTLSACGAIDMWGNCWEWTLTPAQGNKMTIKGGSWKSSRMDCRTEHRGEGRETTERANDIGFRIVREN